MNSENFLTKFFSVVAAVALIAGCSTAGIEAIGTPASSEKPKELVIHSDALANKVTISDMRSRAVGGLLEVNLKLTNLTSRDRAVEYRFTWFDADEFEVEPATDAWTPVSLHGAQSVTVHGVAPNSKVTSYRLNVKGQ